MVSPRQLPDGRQRIGRSVQALVHRGPDAGGYYVSAEGNVVLGHRRLCIIDPGPAAAQPLSAGRHHMVYNGELYNYLELREELEGRGHHFLSHSDSEVVLAAYAAWGPACLQRFDGMFAFAVWDEARNCLFAARDRFGEKPFYFHYDEDQLFFASEMKALWAAGVPKRVNEGMLYNFLAIGYTSNPGNPSETFYENIHKLPAASFLAFFPAENRLQLEQYWQGATTPPADMDAAEAARRLDELLTRSVSRRLRSDVPVGTSLSGGLDSSAIVAYCEKAASGPYSHKCFTAAFEGFERNELPFAREVAQHFSLHHYITTISPGEVVDLMQRVARAQEAPFLSASPLAQYKVYELAAAEGVKVVLDGQGADEILAGYHKYYRWHWGALYRERRLKSSGEAAATKALGVDIPFGAREKMAALFPELAAALQQSRVWKKAFRQPYLDRDFAFTYKRHLHYALPHTHDLNGALYFNSFVYGLEELLHLADRNSSAHGVEVRLPFLQHELVDFLFSLPPQLKIRQGWTKWLLRQTAAPLLPASITWRKDKTGFEPPQRSWMQLPAVQEAIHAGKKQLVDRGYLQPSVLRQKIQPHDAHAAEGRDWRFWSASMLFA